MFELDPMSRMPLYEQLQTRILRKIMLGLLKAGDQLPSVRQLAMDLGINPNTVQKAYRELERRGVILSLGGRGSFVSDDAALQARLRGGWTTQIVTAVREALAAGMPAEDVQSAVSEALSSNDDAGAVTVAEADRAAVAEEDRAAVAETDRAVGAEEDKNYD